MKATWSSARISKCHGNYIINKRFSAHGEEINNTVESTVAKALKLIKSLRETPRITLTPTPSTKVLTLKRWELTRIPTWTYAMVVGNG